MGQRDIPGGGGGNSAGSKKRFALHRGAPHTLPTRPSESDRSKPQALVQCGSTPGENANTNLPVPLDLNDCLTIDFSPVAALSARVVWLSGNDCGLAFEGPIDWARLLMGATAQEDAGDRRTRTSMAVKSPSSSGMCGAVATDVWHGIKTANDENFLPGLKVRVILDDGSEQDGIVRWSQENIASVLLVGRSLGKGAGH